MLRGNFIPFAILNVAIRLLSVCAEAVVSNPTLSPLSTTRWSDFKGDLRDNKALKDQVFEVQSNLRGTAKYCPNDRGQGSPMQQNLNLPNSLNALIQGARQVIKLLDAAINSNDPSSVGFDAVENAIAERAKLNAYLNGIIKFQREFLVAVLKFYPFWKENIDMAQNWVYYATSDRSTMVVYAASDGPSKRAELAQTAEEIGKRALEYIKGAAQWAASSSENEAFNSLLADYNPDSAQIDYTLGTELWREGTGWIEPGGATDTFTLQTLFDRMADWFDCWVNPLPDLITVLQEHPALEEVNPDEDPDS
ncbi:hypothetical protein TWF718_001124 [Orbilia javanica]|uniref:Uncharacterized protein n=1 Tax=Orbilia javanica TaxID=47235 RepID=A0AAN8MY54_9PEZI